MWNSIIYRWLWSYSHNLNGNSIFFFYIYKKSIVSHDCEHFVWFISRSELKKKQGNFMFTIVTLHHNHFHFIHCVRIFFPLICLRTGPHQLVANARNGFIFLYRNASTQFWQYYTFLNIRCFVKVFIKEILK